MHNGEALSGGGPTATPSAEPSPQKNAASETNTSGLYGITNHAFCESA